MRLFCNQGKSSQLAEQDLFITGLPCFKETNNSILIHETKNRKFKAKEERSVFGLVTGKQGSHP